MNNSTCFREICHHKFSLNSFASKLVAKFLVIYSFSAAFGDWQIAEQSFAVNLQFSCFLEQFSILERWELFETFQKLYEQTMTILFPFS